MQTLADCGLPNGKGDSIEHSAFTFEVSFYHSWIEENDEERSLLLQLICQSLSSLDLIQLCIIWCLSALLKRSLFSHIRCSIRSTRPSVQEPTSTTFTRLSAKRRSYLLPSWSSFWTRSSETRGWTRSSTRSTTRRGWTSKILSSWSLWSGCGNHQQVWARRDQREGKAVEQGDPSRM